jgi:maleate isomerase
MARLSDIAEFFIGKPVVAINVATYWHALRSNGLLDKIHGFGQLLANH